MGGSQEARCWGETEALQSRGGHLLRFGLVGEESLCDWQGSTSSGAAKAEPCMVRIVSLEAAGEGFDDAGLDGA